MCPSRLVLAPDQRDCPYFALAIGSTSRHVWRGGCVRASRQAYEATDSDPLLTSDVTDHWSATVSQSAGSAGTGSCTPFPRPRRRCSRPSARRRAARTAHPRERTRRARYPCVALPARESRRCAPLRLRHPCPALAQLATYRRVNIRYVRAPDIHQSSSDSAAPTSAATSSAFDTKYYPGVKRKACS